jgi:hypothetical protein
LRSLRALPCAIVLVALPAGCGSSGSSDQQSVRKVVDAYDAALAAGDFKTACSYASARAKADLIAAVGRSGGAAAADCPSAMKVAFASSPVASEVAKTIKPGAIHVTGDRATVDVSAKVSGRTVATKSYAVRESGAWKVSSAQVGGG